LKTAKSLKIARWLRRGLLALLLLWVTYEATMHQVLGGGKSPSIHALCPYGALESLYALAAAGTMIQKIYWGTFIILAVTVVIALLFRRSFCGLLCPFGALQELFARFGGKVFRKRPAVPARADKILRYLKYAVLVLTVVLAWRTGRLWMTSYDPYAAFGHITAIPETLAEDPLSIVSFILLGVTLLGSFIYDRFFCKYLCPAGAFYALVGKLSPTRIQRQDDLCIHCNLCSHVCPVNLDVAKLDHVTQMECLSCNECVAVCPKQGALEVRFARKKVHPLILLGIVAAVFFVPLGIAQAAGVLQVINEAPQAGEISTFAELKGFMTIAESAAALGLPETDLRAALDIPQDIPADTRMSQLSTLIEGYDFDAAKEAADEAAGHTLASEPDPSENEPAATASGSVSANPEAIDVTPVKGSMTIAEAAQAIGMDENAFYNLFQIPVSVDAATRMKDIANIVPGYDFSTVKELLKAG